jgi:hypothetical protein
MKKLLIYPVAGIVAVGAGSPARAVVSLSLEPTPKLINVGDPASLDLVVSGLGNLSAPSLAGFDFDLTYNAAIVDAVSLTFGSFLGLSAQFTDLSTAGAIHLDEVSFESPTDLNNAQPDTFTLATLNFNGVAPGSSPIIFAFASLSDEDGQSLSGFSINTGLIEVARATGVPDIASTASLLLLGIASLSALRRCPQRD